MGHLWPGISSRFDSWIPRLSSNKDTPCSKEYHYDHLIRWPRGERAAVFLTFDFQGGEDVKPDKNGILNYEMWSQGEYGPHHAIYRLLRILKEENIKATFLTCGAACGSSAAPRPAGPIPSASPSTATWSTSSTPAATATSPASWTSRGHLFAVPGWTQPLSGAGTSPEQIAFSPDGRVLVVTEKGANEIVTYRVGWFGRAGAPDVQASAGAAPYGFAFDGRGRLFVSEAAASALSSYAVGPFGELTTLSASVVNGQLAACWVALTPNGREAYTIDAHSSTISSYAIHADGSITLDQGLAAGTGARHCPARRQRELRWSRPVRAALGDPADQHVRHRRARHPHADRDRLGPLRGPQRARGSLIRRSSRARRSCRARRDPFSPGTISAMAPDRDRPILVVDDDAKIVRLVRTYLERERYRVIEAFDGAAALEAIAAHDPALVVLDLMIAEDRWTRRRPGRTRPCGHPRSSSSRLAA